jgi:hypothetical protein
MTTTGRFALIELPEHGPAPTDAIMVGPMSACTEPILGSKGREEAAEILQFCRDSAAQHQQHAARLQQVEATLANVRADLSQIIGDFCDYFSEMKADREAERQRIAAEEASPAELRAAMDALPVGDGELVEPAVDPLEGPRNEVDDEEPHGELPEPPLQPSLRKESDPPNADRRYPDDQPSGALPPELERRTPPPLGTMPVWNIKDLKHPQEIPPTPSAIGGPLARK